VIVCILLEGQPVGGMTTMQKEVASTLSSKGCQIQMMSDNGSFRRYEFLHAKYAIFDRMTVLMTSENWGSGLHHNRGWGVIVRSEVLANRMEMVFENDMDGSWGDLSTPKGDIGEIGSCSLECVPYQRTWTSAAVTLIVSPDGSLGEIKGMIGQANERLFIEEMSFDPEWGTETGLISAIRDAGGRGTITKVLLDGTSSDLQNRMTIDQILGPRPIDVEARLETSFHSFTMIHNKGIISDDRVLISSINLGHNALSENREVGLIITSKEVSDIFASIFQLDWLPDPDPPNIEFELTRLVDGGVESIAIDASSSWDESGLREIRWDLDLDGVFELEGARAVVQTDETPYQVMVQVTDNNGNIAERSIDVPASTMASPGLTITPWFGAVPLALLALFFLRKRIK
jgi:phosphatidylserine/phosphatidylglycerophosphate/cardiolipin synthase-like enzyme